MVEVWVKKIKGTLATLLTMVMLATNCMTVLAAEPTQPAVAENTIDVSDVSIPEVAPQANDGSEDDGIMPLGIGGYSAKYTNPTIGYFYVDAPGDGNGSGTFQITTHDFSTNPNINTVLYRPDGTCAGQIYITGNGTKQMRFSNAIPGTYKIVYSVSSDVGGWISAWVSS